MPSKASICLNPIGLVETDIPDADVAHRRREMISDIVVFDQYLEGLTGLTDYSHIIVLFWMHRALPSEKLLVRPRGDASLPLTGVLASRGRGHPNPIGLAVAELLERNGPRLTVRRLDAYNGTPVIDIKPYDRYDIVTDIRMPAWFDERLRQNARHDAKSSG